jgi:hypothetical protein
LELKKKQKEIRQNRKGMYGLREKIIIIYMNVNERKDNKGGIRCVE